MDAAVLRYPVGIFSSPFGRIKSTAERQAEREQKQRLASERKYERRVSKVCEQIKIDMLDAIFKENGKSGKEMKAYLEEMRDKFQRDIETRGPQDAIDSTIDSINVANGALGAERASGRERTGLLRDVAVAAGAGELFKRLASISFPALAAYFPVIAILGTIAGSIVKLHRLKKRGKGEASDSIEKEQAAIEKINIILPELEKLDKKVDNDRPIILENMKNMDKKEFKAYLKNYVLELKKEFERICKGVVEELQNLSEQEIEQELTSELLNENAGNVKEETESDEEQQENEEEKESEDSEENSQESEKEELEEETSEPNKKDLSENDFNSLTEEEIAEIEKIGEETEGLE